MEQFLNARQVEESHFDQMSSSNISEITLDEVGIREEKPPKMEALREPENRMYDVIESGIKSNTKTPYSIRMYRVRRELKMRQFNTANIPEDNEYLREAKRIYPQGFVDRNVKHAAAKTAAKTAKTEKLRSENSGTNNSILNVKELNLRKERDIYGHNDESQHLYKMHTVEQSSNTICNVRKRSHSYDSVVGARLKSLTPLRTSQVLHISSKKKQMLSEGKSVNVKYETIYDVRKKSHSGNVRSMNLSSLTSRKALHISSRKNVKSDARQKAGHYPVPKYILYNNYVNEDKADNQASRSETAGRSSSQSDPSINSAVEIDQPRKKFFSSKEEKTDASNNVDAEEILQQRMRRKSRRWRRKNKNLDRYIVEMYSLRSKETTITSKPDTVKSSKMENTGYKNNSDNADETSYETMKIAINTTKELNKEVVEEVSEMKSVSQPDQNNSASLQENEGDLNEPKLEESKQIPPNDYSENIIDEIRIQDGNSTLVLYKVREKCMSENNEDKIDSNQTIYNNDLQQIENGNNRSDGKLTEAESVSTDAKQEKVDKVSDNFTYSIENENSHESHSLKSVVNINEDIGGCMNDYNSYNSSTDAKPSQQLTSVSENENRENASSHDNLSGQVNSKKEKNVSVLDDPERSDSYEGEDNNSLTESTKQSNQNTSEIVELNNQNGYYSDETELSANQSLNNQVNYTTFNDGGMREKRPQHLVDKGTVDMKKVTRIDSGSSQQGEDTQDRNQKIEVLNNVFNPRSESGPSRDTVEVNENVKKASDPRTLPYQQGGLQNPSTSKKTSTSLSSRTMSSETRVFLLVEKARQANKLHINENTQTLDLLQQMRLSLYKELDIMKGNIPEEPPEDHEPDSTETTENPEKTSEHTEPPGSNKIKKSLGHRLSEEKLIEIHDKYWKHDEEVQIPTTKPIVVNQNAGTVKSIKKKASTKIDTKWDPKHPLYETIQSGFKSNIKIPDSNGMHRAHKEHKELKTKKFNTEHIPEDNVYLQEAKRIYPQGFEDTNEKPVKHAKTHLASKSDYSGLSISVQKPNETHTSKDRNNNEHTDINHHSQQARKDVHPLKQSRDKRTRTENVEGTDNTNSRVRKRSHSKDYGDGARSKSSSPLRTREELQTVSSRKKNLRTDGEAEEKLKAGHDFTEKNHKLVNTDTKIKNNSHKQNGYITGLSQANKTKTPPIKFSSNSKNPNVMHSDGHEMEHKSTDDRMSRIRTFNRQPENSPDQAKGHSDSPALRLGNASKSSLQSDISISTAIEIVQSRNKFLSNSDEEKKSVPREHRVYKLFREIQKIRHMAAPMAESYPDDAEDGEMFINDPQSGFLFMNYNQTPHSVSEHKTSSELNRFLSSNFDYEVCSKVKSVKTRRRDRALEMLRQNIASKS